MTLVGPARTCHNALWCAPVNGLAGCYVSTIGKPHEYFDLTGTPTGNGEKQIGRAYGAPCQPSTLPRWSLTRSLLGRTVPPLMPRVPTIIVKEPYKDSTGGDFKLGGTMGGVVIYTPLTD